MVMPGDNARIEVRLDKPIALEAGSRFAIREGGGPSARRRLRGDRVVW